MAFSRSSAAGNRRHPIHGAGAVVRLVAVVAIGFGWFLSASSAGAQADDGLDGDTYTSEDYGWSVQFDDRVWSAEAIDERNSQGLTLSSDTNEVFVNLVVYDDGITDAQDCLDDLDRAFTTSRDWEDVEVARSLDAPETADDAVGEVYTGALVLDDGSIDLVLFLECREVQDATLTVAVTALEEAYEDFLPDLADLLTAVDTGGSSNGDPDDGPSPDGPVTRGGDDDPTPEEEPTQEADDPTREADDPTPDAELTPENDRPVLDHEPDDVVGQDAEGILDDGSYVSEVGYSLAWDAEVWTGETPDDAGTGVLLENGDSGATMEVAAFEDPDIEDCIDAEIGRVVDSPDYVSAAISNGVRPPTSADDAVGRTIRATEDTTQQQRKLIYVECRPLLDEGEDGDPVFLVVRAISDDEDFRTSRTAFETILGSITIGDEPAPEPTAKATKEPTKKATKEPEDEPTPRPRRTPTAEAQDLGETDLAEGVFVGVAFPVRVEFSTDVYTAEPLTGDGIEGFTFSSDLGSFGRIVTANTGGNATIDQCIESLVAPWRETSPDLGPYEPPAGQEIEWPDGTGIVYGTGTLTLEDGRQVTLINAGGCLELDGGQGLLIMQMQTFDGLFAENAAAFTEVLASIEIADGGQVGAVPAPARASGPRTRGHEAVHRRERLIAI